MDARTFFLENDELATDSDDTFFFNQSSNFSNLISKNIKITHC